MRKEKTNRFNGLSVHIMALHSYSRCWLHLVWGTLKREGMFTKTAAVEVSKYLTNYANTKGIYMKVNFVNTDHVHMLIDLPTDQCIEDVVQLFKGSSSHWINEGTLVSGRFAWGRGYGAFSVSESMVGEVANYIANQEEHHWGRSFDDELKLFIERHGLKWHEC